MTPPFRTVAIADLERIVSRALEAVGTSPENAASVTQSLVAAEIDGLKGHGLSRVASYAGQVLSGKVDGRARPAVRHTRTGTIVVDAAHGFAFPAFDLALAELPSLARHAGIAAAGVTRSHHAGALGLVVERLAAKGLVAMMFANTPLAMAPWGGKRPQFGTNPIAFAAPRSGGHPVVVDMALSEVARGKIMAAAQKGESIPEGWATDHEGHPTTDAKAALEGTLVPAGSAKGAALALMVELLAAAVTGAHFAGEASSFLDAKGPPPGTGQLLLAIDPSALGAGTTFADRFASLASGIEEEPGVRLPGSRRWALRTKAAAEGVTVESGLLSTIEKLIH